MSSDIPIPARKITYRQLTEKERQILEKCLGLLTQLEHNLGETREMSQLLLSLKEQSQTEMMKEITGRATNHVEMVERYIQQDLIDFTKFQNDITNVLNKGHVTNSWVKNFNSRLRKTEKLASTINALGKL